MGNLDDLFQDEAHRLIPLYHKLALFLRSKIISGELPEGEYIPSEGQLAEIYSLSRTTVRQAIAELTREGLLERHQGKGTLVRRQKLQRVIPGLSSFTEEIAATGHQPGAETVGLETFACTNARVSTGLQVEPGDNVVRLLRKRYVDDELLGISESYYREEFWNSLHAMPEDFKNSSFYSFLESRGHILAWATENIEAVSCDRALARLLGISIGMPILVLERTVYGRDDSPIEHAFNKFRGDKYQVRLEHKRYRK